MTDPGCDPKAQNRDRVLALLFAQGALSKPQLSQLTGLSMPTINTHMRDLSDAGLIEPGEMLNSSGGRPALSYRINPAARLAIGVDIHRDRLNLCVVDLAGQAVHFRAVDEPYADTSEYSSRLPGHVERFLQDCAIPRGRLLGVGITMQAVTDREGLRIIYSGIVPTAHFDPAPLSERLGLPVRLCHDVKAAAQAELWLNPGITNGVYVAMSEHLGGALIKSHRIEHGRFGYAGSFEHLTLGHEGRMCYCGRQDCLETYCSNEALLRGETPEAFFAALREGGDPSHMRRWDDYLGMLSRGLYQVWLLLERRIILGGELACMLEDEDVARIEQMILRYCTFTYGDRGIVERAVVLRHAAAIGTALPFLAAAIPEQARPIEAWPAADPNPTN
ncbi:MAG: ROK family transcriptional regulator [Succinivibrionaceae bacterium]|nr:ROK family transcriptional regulator [Succinivibrionaceae bacterium]